MGLLKRFGWYFLGVGIGTIFVVMIFGGRDIQCNYFPNSRVLVDISRKDLAYSDEVMCQMQCAGIDTTAINQLIVNGKVNFEESDTKKDSCKEYQIYSKDFTPEFTARFKNCDSTAYLMKVDLLEVKEVSDCNCN